MHYLAFWCKTPQKDIFGTGYVLGYIQFVGPVLIQIKRCKLCSKRICQQCSGEGGVCNAEVHRAERGKYKLGTGIKKLDSTANKYIE